MRPSKFLPYLLPLAGCGLASSQQSEKSKQICPSTGVDPVPLLTVFNGLTSISRNMRLGLLQINKTTAAEITMDITSDMLIESYILFEYADRLRDTPPFDQDHDTAALAVGFVKWKRHTSDFLVRAGQSSETLHKVSPDLIPVLKKCLIQFKRAATNFCRVFQAAIPNLDRHLGRIELSITGENSNLPATFEHTIRSLTNNNKRGKSIRA